MTRVEEPIIDRLEILLKIPMPQQVDEADWHQHAAEVFVPDQPDLPPRILAASQEVIMDLPLDEIETILSAPSLAPEALKTIKHTRRIAMIGRDALSLTAMPPLPAAIDPYILLTKNLGLIADTKGNDAAILASTLGIVRSIDRRAIESSAFAAHMPEDLRRECDRRYNSSTLLNRCSDQSSLELHGARIGLRRVVHLGMMACAVEQTPDGLRYLASGLRLNKIYGSFHQRVVRTSGAETVPED